MTGPKIANIGSALIITRGDLTRVCAGGAHNFKSHYWLRADGAIGIEAGGIDRVHSFAPKGKRMTRTATTNVTDAMNDLAQQVIDLGLALAGIADVPPKD